MTKQDIFNRIVTFIRKQGDVALDKDGRCMYRAPNGMKCAVGCLLTDAYYDSEFEGQAIDQGNSVVKAVENSLGIVLTDDYIQMLADLQAAHDGAKHSNDHMAFFNSEAEAVAHKHKLTMPEAS